MSISPDLTGGFIIKGWGQIVLLGTTTIKKCRKKDFYNAQNKYFWAHQDFSVAGPQGAGGRLPAPKSGRR